MSEGGCVQGCCFKAFVLTKWYRGRWPIASRTRDASQYHCLLRRAENSWMLMEDLNGFLTGHEDGDVRFWTFKDFSSFSVYNAKGTALTGSGAFPRFERVPLFSGSGV